MLKPEIDNIEALQQFLRVPTPVGWLESATQQIPLLLVDHAHCERKAAATALNFMSKYPDIPEVIAIMSPLAREELLHFEKVMMLLEARNIKYDQLPPSLYAQKMHQYITKKNGLMKLGDQLIVGAIIEARSCERFNALVSVLQDDVLSKFYAALVKAEARHFQDYLRLAYQFGKDIDLRIQMFLDIENELIAGKDTVFRFHSGIPYQSN